MLSVSTRIPNAEPGMVENDMKNVISNYESVNAFPLSNPLMKKMPESHGTL